MANSLQIYEETIDLCGGGSSRGTSYTPLNLMGFSSFNYSLWKQTFTQCRIAYGLVQVYNQQVDGSVRFIQSIFIYPIREFGVNGGPLFSIFTSWSEQRGYKEHWRTCPVLHRQAIDLNGHCVTLHCNGAVGKLNTYGQACTQITAGGPILICLLYKQGLQKAKNPFKRCSYSSCSYVTAVAKYRTSLYMDCLVKRFSRASLICRCLHYD